MIKERKCKECGKDISHRSLSASYCDKTCSYQDWYRKNREEKLRYGNEWNRRNRENG